MSSWATVHLTCLKSRWCGWQNVFCLRSLTRVKRLGRVSGLLKDHRKEGGEGRGERGGSREGRRRGRLTVSPDL